MQERNPFDVSGIEDNRRSARISGQAVTTITIFAITLAMVFASRLVSASFGGWNQIETILYLGSFLVFCSFGQGLVILVRGLDLSIASVIALGGILTTSMMNGADAGIWYIVPVILLACGGVGLISGLGVALLNVPPFIMTMAVGLITYSACLGLTGGTPRGYPAPMLSDLMAARPLGLPAPVLLLLLFVVIGTAIQSYSGLGRKLNAVGNNPRAAHIAGLSSRRLIASAYVISAVCAGFTGIMLTGYSHGATLRMGDDYLLSSIAAVVVGGSSIVGGKGSFLGTVGGALLLTTLSTVLSALGIAHGWKTIIEGSVILIALIALREQFFTAVRVTLKQRS